MNQYELIHANIHIHGSHVNTLYRNDKTIKHIKLFCSYYGEI